MGQDTVYPPQDTAIEGDEFELVDLVGATAGTVVLTTRVSGDGSNRRFRIYANGDMEWGDGAGAYDVTVDRGAAGRLDIGGAVQTAGHITAGTPNSYDVGGSGTEFRTGRFATSVITPTVRGGTGSGGVLALSSTSHATKGYVELDGNVRLYALSNTLIQANGANAQLDYIYNTVDDPLSPVAYERIQFGWASNIAYFRTVSAGGGSARQISITSADQIVFQTNGGNTRARIDTSGHFLAQAANTYDLGGSSNTWRNIYAGTQFLGPGGSDSAPDLARQSSTNSGITLLANGIEIVNAGVNTVTIASNLTVRSAGLIQWSSTSDPSTGTPDVVLARDAANTLAQRNAADGQAHRVYGTFTNALNYERLAIACNTTSASVVHQIAGTGTSRELVFGTSGASRIRLYTNNSNRWEVSASGHLLGMTDNTYDIGASGATRPRTGYFGTSINVVAGAVLLDTNGITMGDAKNIIANATTGTKIGTATSQKFAFWNATPVVQQAHIADPAGGSTVDAEARTAINAINAMLAATGLTAAS